MIMLAIGGMLIGAVFPLTGFTEMPRAGAGSVSQQPIQQSEQQMLQQPIQQITQPQPSAMSYPPELKMQMYRVMQARLGATGRNIGPAFTGNVGDFPGSTPQPGITNQAQQYNLELMQALMQRKQNG